MSAPDGLTSVEAEARLRAHGPNALPAAEVEPQWRRFVRQFRSPLIYILLFALVVDLAVWSFAGESALPYEALVIGIILLLNAGLGVWQEAKAEAALSKLEQLAAPQVWVLRDGTLVHVDATRVVPGDVVRLEAGDRVPADGQGVELANFQVDESVLTGESLPVAKQGAAELLAGTLVVRGHGYARVTRTGSESAMGRLAQMLSAVEDEKSPLERRLERFGTRVARWVVLLSLAIGGAGLVTQGLSHFGEIFLFAVALAVAAVPEGLPAVLTVTLALGVERMARRRAVVRKLAAVEALGSVTVIATDKTGTLTENRMEVRRVDTPDEQRALLAMVLANDADRATGAGDPLDLALLEHARTCGHDHEATAVGYERCAERPFDSQWKFMRATCHKDGRTTSFLKGAPEVLLERSDLPADQRARWRQRMEGYAAEGFRLLGLAAGEGEREEGLQWLGLALLWDPPRPEVAEAVKQARAAGIRVVMITGDHPATACTVAKAVGIADRRVVVGTDLDACEDASAFDDLVADADVLARVSPEHKLRVVESLQRRGEIVAVTGDGVNDAPALKRADVGVAMGERGSDVSREVADLILLDDDFATIVAAIEEGRSIYENIEKFIRFLFSTNLSEVLVVSIGAFAAFALGLYDEAGSLLLPLTAAQLLWINLVTDGAPALALGLDRNPGVMQHRPRDPSASLLDRPSLAFVVFSGGMKAALALAMLALVAPLTGESTAVARTATFAFLAAGQLLFAYPARHTDLRPPHNLLLHVAVAAGLAIQIAVLAVPALMTAFDTVALGPRTIGWVVASMLVSWAAAEVTTRVIWRPNSARPSAAV